MMNPLKVQEIADAAARKNRGGTPFTDAVRSAMRGKDIREADWDECFSAVAAELSRRSHEMRPRKPEPIKLTAPQKEPQLGFGFGEGPRRKRRAA